jgi:hypothetical protein
MRKTSWGASPVAGASNPSGPAKARISRYSVSFFYSFLNATGLSINPTAYAMYIHCINERSSLGEGFFVNKKDDKKDKKKAGKKDSQLILRLDKAERDEFIALCKDMDTSAAREIRAFIRDFVKKNS